MEEIDWNYGNYDPFMEEIDWHLNNDRNYDSFMGGFTGISTAELNIKVKERIYVRIINL